MLHALAEEGWLLTFNVTPLLIGFLLTESMTTTSQHNMTTGIHYLT